MKQANSINATEMFSFCCVLPWPGVLEAFASICGFSECADLQSFGISGISGTWEMEVKDLRGGSQINLRNKILRKVLRFSRGGV